jgi:peptide/nickel transport system substrate-binding protein
LKGFRVLYIAMVFLVVFSVIGVASENRPEYGGTLTIGMPVAPQGWFNPLISSSKYDQDVIKHIFNGLLEIGPDMEYIPSLAERWEFSEDGLEWTFYLRDDVRWHDGKAFTTKDVNFTFTMLLHPKYFGGKGADFIFIEGAREFKSGEAQFVSGIQVIDDYTIKFRLTESFAPFMESMTFPILPEHLLKDVPVAELDKASFNLHPVGTGPYKLQRYVNGQYVELKVNDLYFAGRPYIDSIIYKIITNEDAMIIALGNGEIDIAEIQPKYLDYLKAMSNLIIYEYPNYSEGYAYMGLNLRKPVFESKTVRQALAYAIPRDLFVQTILKGYGEVANAPISPLNWAYSDELNDYPYDPRRAAELLDEAGWIQGHDGSRSKDGQRFEFDLMYPAGDRIRGSLAAIIQGTLRSLGIKVNLMPTEPNALAASTFPKLFGKTSVEPEFDAYILAWTLYGVDPDPYIIWHSQSPYNGIGFANLRSDELLEKGRSILELDERKKIYWEWQTLINDELPYIFMYFKKSVVGVNKRVMGIQPCAFGITPDICDLWLNLN